MEARDSQAKVSEVFMVSYENLIQVIQQGNFLECEKLVRELLQQGNSPNEII